MFRRAAVERDMSIQPDIQYVTSRDGTRLAMAVWGTGLPAVRVTLHLGGRLGSSGIGTRHWHHALSPYLNLAHFDARGCGLSDRHDKRISLDACVEDLEAVVDALGPDPVVLLGLTHGSLVAIRFAALHPERVSRLILYGGYARGRLRRDPDAAQTKEAQAILEAIQVAFGDEVPYSAAFRLAVSSRFFPSASPQELDEVNAGTVGRFSADVARAYTAMTFEADVSEPARRVTCPTLLFHARGDLVVPFEEGSRLASLIPGVRFVPLDDDSNQPLESNPQWPRVVDELHEFLGITQTLDGASRSSTNAAPSGPNLTLRQVEVLRLVSQGHTDKEIARLLGLSPRTVEMHAGRALRALKCRTRAEGVHLATQLGLLGQ
jgi:pimeloyl-ACP methyl ester carboxylesterase/DNA-binding CsgD family transcriptional regulator